MNTERKHAHKFSVIGLAIGTWILFIPQFVVGMGTNLWGQIPDLSGKASTMTIPGRMGYSLVWSLGQGPTFLRIHVFIALTLVLLALVNLIWTWKKHKVWLAVLAFLGFGELVAATINGIFFVLYQQDVNSFIMSIAFISAVTSYAIEIYLLNRGRKDGRK